MPESHSETSHSHMQSLSSFLVQAREAKGLELGDIARLTNIRKDYLLALEKGHYEQLPEAIYSRNFVRLYAQVLGLDVQEALSLYRRDQGDDTSLTVPEEPSRKYGPNESRRTLAWIPAFVLIAGLMVLSFWLVNRFFMGANPSLSAQPDTTVQNLPLRPAENLAITEEDPSVATLELESSADISLAEPGDVGTDDLATDDSATGTLAQAELGAGLEPGETIFVSIITNPPGAEVNLDGYVLPGTTPLLEVPVSSSLNRTLSLSLNGYEVRQEQLDLNTSVTLSFDLIPESASATSEASEAVVGSSGPGEIALSIEDLTWVEVYQGSSRGGGERLIYTTLQPGESFVFSLPVFLHVGNAGGVRVSLDGQDLGLLGSSGEVLSRAFSQQTVSQEAVLGAESEESPAATETLPETSEPAQE